MPRDIARAAADRRLENRSPFQRQVKDCVAALFRENGGHKCAVDRFGVSLARAYRFTDHHCDEQISFARVAALTSAKTMAAARYLAGLAGGTFLPLPAPKEMPPLVLLADAVDSHASAISSAVRALADGKIEASEAAAVAKTIDKALWNLTSLRAKLVTMAAGE